MQSVIGAFKDDDADVRSSAVSALGSQSSLPEAAMHSHRCTQGRRRRCQVLSSMGIRQPALAGTSSHAFPIGALKDEKAHVRSNAASALRHQSSLPEAAIQSLIGALKDDGGNVRSKAASALGSQSSLSEVAMHSLIGALKDEDAGVRSSAVSALGNQSSLSEAAIQSIAEALNRKNEDIERVLNIHQQGFVRTEPLDADKAALIASAFEAVQQEAWTQLDAM
ncbi:unnamed protein product [Mortierella alpina]